jgi:AraC-like DNA-binding protein
MSARTLARKLADEGSSYRELLDDVRKQLALRALARSERSIEELASALGFASSQGFHRAFRRWTRTSPSRYRSRMRKKATATRRARAGRARPRSSRGGPS